MVLYAVLLQRRHRRYPRRHRNRACGHPVGAVALASVPELKHRQSRSQ